MNLVRPTLCAFFALAALAATPAAFALDFCPIQVPSLTPSLPNIPAAPAIQIAPAPAQAMPAPAQARAARMSANADGEPNFFHTPEYAPSVTFSGDDDGCVPIPVKPIHRPHLNPQCMGDTVDLRGVDTNKPVKLLR